MIVLFTAIFSMMSLIQDRNEGFLLSVLASPASRSAIVLGKVLGRRHAGRRPGHHLPGLCPAGRRAPDAGAILLSIWRHRPDQL